MFTKEIAAFTFVVIGTFGQVATAGAKTIVVKPAYSDASYANGFRMTVTKKSVRVYDLSKDSRIPAWTGKLVANYKPQSPKYLGMKKFDGLLKYSPYSMESASILFNPAKKSGKIFLRQQDGEGGGTETYRVATK